jgi:Flp pilus assembly pilin Flp
MLDMTKPAATRISDSICRSYIWVRESPRGQTLTEYALIFAALSLAVFAAYESIGNSIVVLGNGLNSDLTSA